MDYDGGLLDKIPGASTDHKIPSTPQPLIMATAEGRVGIPANASLAIKPARAFKAQAADVPPIFDLFENQPRKASLTLWFLVPPPNHRLCWSLAERRVVAVT